jgi:hypothetical protein
MVQGEDGLDLMLVKVCLGDASVYGFSKDASYFLTSCSFRLVFALNVSTFVRIRSEC